MGTSDSMLGRGRITLRKTSIPSTRGEKILLAVDKLQPLYIISLSVDFVALVNAEVQSPKDKTKTNKQTSNQRKIKLQLDFNFIVLVSTYPVRAILIVLVKLKITAIVAIRQYVFSHPLI